LVGAPAGHSEFRIPAARAGKNPRPRPGFGGGETVGDNYTASNMDRDAKTPQEWGEAFSRVRSLHVDFTDALARLVRQMLDQEDIELAQLEARTKSVDSLSEKISRKGSKYADPLTEVTDLVGLRVIVYYPDNVATVGAMLEREFDPDWEHSWRQDPGERPDRFGYRSDHYVVRLKRQRRLLPEWSRFADACAEIQVRTVMQHAWAAVDHKIRYKGPDLPVELQRRLYRLSALLELADEQFAALQQVREQVIDSYETSVKQGDLGVGLDALSLRAYLDQTTMAEHWARRATTAGFVSVGGDDHGQTGRTEELLKNLQKAEITHLDHFEALLGSANDWGDSALKLVAEETAVAARATTSSGTVRAFPEYVLLILVHLATKSAEAVDEAKWRKDIARGIKAAFGAADYRPPN
jgi:putative GTP pyrophosphokinase